MQSRPRELRVVRGRRRSRHAGLAQRRRRGDSSRRKHGRGNRCGSDRTLPRPAPDRRPQLYDRTPLLHLRHDHLQLPPGLVALQRVGGSRLPAGASDARRTVFRSRGLRLLQPGVRVPRWNLDLQGERLTEIRWTAPGVSRNATSRSTTRRRCMEHSALNTCRIVDRLRLLALGRRHRGARRLRIQRLDLGRLGRVRRRLLPGLTTGVDVRCSGWRRRFAGHARHQCSMHATLLSPTVSARSSALKPRRGARAVRDVRRAFRHTVSQPQTPKRLPEA